jgi:hypothetical protein
MHEAVWEQHITKKHIFLYILIGFCSLLCISTIYFVIDTYFIHPVPYPINVSVSNIQKTSATVTYVSSQSQQSCVLLLNISKLFVRAYCEEDKTKIHSVDVSGLRPNTAYNMYVGSGIRWRQKGINSINGVLVDSEYKPTGIASFTTLVSDVTRTTANASIYLGKVLGKNRTPESYALVLVRNLQSGTLWSTLTNGLGNFAVTLPDVQLTDEVGIMVWGLSGHISLNQSISLLGDKPVTIILQPYE